MRKAKYLSMIMSLTVCASTFSIPMAAYADEETDVSDTTVSTFTTSESNETPDQTTTTTTSIYDVHEIVDPEIIRNMLNKFITDNGFDARCAEPGEYPDETRVVLEFSINNSDSINIKVVQFMTENGINPYYNICFVPVDNDLKITSVNPDVTTSTETTTTTAVTTTTVPDTTHSTTSYNSSETLPQTGYSDAYKWFTGLASFMTISGISIVIKTRKKDNE